MNSTGPDFTIQGLTDIPELQLPIFLIFLIAYFIIIWGNMTLFIAVLSDANIHTPMYIFLMKLSFIDIMSTSNVLPELLYILLTKRKTISFAGCISQMYVFTFLTCTEYVLLAVMAYDRYVAICHPLRYCILMSLRHCALLIMCAWTIGLTDPMPHAVLISKMSFCASHLIDHFFCDVSPVLKLSCSDMTVVEILTYAGGVFVVIPAFMLTLISYVFIISTILKIKSSEGRRKAFSTCASHLTSVTIFYWTILCLYLRPTSSYSPKQDKFFAIIYAVLVPLLNPIIYSLKNQEVQAALLKLKNKIAFCSKGPDWE
ncbi:olfactory receptor 13G1-like [Spea bombifrons]|uniref:olfactory receptor 13G1-like n=1 Tax=Spea bombifrons TaxID=233779 RepID=UPI0023494ED2|nr:olfactory receptor 13G1-like [Spea bombifrons]